MCGLRISFRKNSFGDFQGKAGSLGQDGLTCLPDDSAGHATEAPFTGSPCCALGLDRASLTQCNSVVRSRFWVVTEVQRRQGCAAFHAERKGFPSRAASSFTCDVVFTFRGVIAWIFAGMFVGFVSVGRHTYTIHWLT